MILLGRSCGSVCELIETKSPMGTGEIARTFAEITVRDSAKPESLLRSSREFTSN